MLRAIFEARGERIIGRKIGFTNRQMWVAHGVRTPIWGYCTDRTTHRLEAMATQRVSDFVEPRIEPEIIFGLSKAPLPSMDQPGLIDCIDWVALGYEIVQSIYPDWSFVSSDTIAANALHGALLVGRPQSIASRKEAWQDEIANFTVGLYRDGKLTQCGGGAFVLDSPVCTENLIPLRRRANRVS